eukprot:Transcript_1891.p1 GENE.Transcript_1891~~Transcript_1891.p1  ORF type:complete len:672 (-),score=249.83 Transcript_1891:753-2714(-)
MSWLPNITVCEVGGHNFTTTTSTGFTYTCIVHDVCQQPMLSHNNMLGMVIAICANAVIPFSLNVQKYVHLRNEGPDGKPKQHFIKIPLWWVGILGMIAGEFFNFIAYGYAPTAIVAPVGAVGVFFNGIIATFGPAKEPFTRWHAAGLASIAGGVVMVVSSVPEAQLDLTAHVMVEFVLPDERCYLYLIILPIFCFVYAKFVVSRYKHKHVLVYLVLCAAIGSLTVTSARSFSSLLTDALATETQKDKDKDDNENEEWWGVALISLLLVAVTAIGQTNFLNKAMMHFGNNEVVPVYYTTFTMASVGAGGLVYSEFGCLVDNNGDVDVVHVLLFFFGCCLLFVGVYLVASGRGDAKKFKGGKRLMESGPGADFGIQQPSPSSVCPDTGELAPHSEAGRFPEPDLPWGGLGFALGEARLGLALDGDTQILSGQTEGFTHNNMAMSSLNKGGTFNMAFTAVSTVIEETAQIVEESRSRRTSKNREGSRPGSPTRGLGPSSGSQPGWQLADAAQPTLQRRDSGSSAEGEAPPHVPAGTQELAPAVGGLRTSSYESPPLIKPPPKAVVSDPLQNGGGGGSSSNDGGGSSSNGGGGGGFAEMARVVLEENGLTEPRNGGSPHRIEMDTRRNGHHSPPNGGSPHRQVDEIQRAADEEDAGI